MPLDRAADYTELVVKIVVPKVAVWLMEAWVALVQVAGHMFARRPPRGSGAMFLGLTAQEVDFALANLDRLMAVVGSAYSEDFELVAYVLFNHKQVTYHSIG